MNRRFRLIIVLAVVTVFCLTLAACGSKTFTVNFNANGGLGEATAQQFEVGVEAPLQSNTFTKENHDFLGWSTEQNATTATFTDGQTVKDLVEAGGSVTLYAVWQKHTYTVIFHSNGGEGTMANQEIAVGQATQLAQNAFTKVGHSFVGWALTETATTADYTDGQSVTDLAQAKKTVTLYAVWQELVYTVRFEGNGATSGTMYDQNMTSGVAATLAQNIFSRGYKYDFLGWATDENATTATYTDGQSVTDLAAQGETITLYAVWGEWVVPSRQPQSADALVVENVNDKGKSDLQSDWEVHAYENGWKETSATIQLATAYDGTNGAKLSYWDNDKNYRYGIGYTTENDYDTIAFDFKGNGISQVTLSLANAKYGVYMTYNLQSLPAVWTHYEVSLFDTAWQINYDGKNISVEEGIKLMGLTGYYDVIKWFDILRFTMRGSTSNGANGYSFFDNVTLKQTKSTETTSSTIVYDFGGAYTAELADGTVVKATLNDTNTLMEVATLNLQQNVSFTLDCQQIDIQLTLTSTDMSGTATIGGNGETFTVDSATGSYATILNGAVFNKVYVVDNFESYAATGTGADTTTPDLSAVSGLRGGYYAEYWANDSAYSAPIGGTKWSLAEGSTNYVELSQTAHTGTQSMQLLSRHTGNSRYISMPIVNGGANTVGKGATVGFWVKNISNGEIKIKPYVSYRDTVSSSNIQSNGPTSYSSAKTFTIEANSDWTLCEFSIEQTNDVYGIVLVLMENYAGSRYLLIDDVLLYTASPYATYTDPSDEPQMPEYATVNLDYQSFTANCDYNEEDWKRESLSSDGWKTISGQMRIRQNVTGNFVLNMYTGNQVAYRYSYVGEGAGLGKANYFSIDLGNYYSNPSDVKFKIILIDDQGTAHYLWGSAESYEILSSTLVDGEQTLVNYSKSFDQITVKYFIIEIKGTTSGDQYVYMDNVKLINQ